MITEQTLRNALPLSYLFMNYVSFSRYMQISSIQRILATDGGYIILDLPIIIKIIITSKIPKAFVYSLWHLPTY